MQGVSRQEPQHTYSRANKRNPIWRKYSVTSISAASIYLHRCFFFQMLVNDFSRDCAGSSLSTRRLFSVNQDAGISFTLNFPFASAGVKFHSKGLRFSTFLGYQMRGFSNCADGCESASLLWFRVMWRFSRARDVVVHCNGSPLFVNVIFRLLQETVLERFSCPIIVIGCNFTLRKITLRPYQKGTINENRGKHRIPYYRLHAMQCDTYGKFEG